MYGLMRAGLRAAIRAAVAGVALAASPLAPLPAHAVQPDEILSDPALEARARTISSGLRCLVCQNQSIDDSDAPLARDLRVLVRERLTAGDSDDQVRDYLVARYGDFVLLKPPFNARTFLLWVLPALTLALAVWSARSLFRKPATASPTSNALTGDEEARLAEVLKRTDEGRAGD